MSDLNFDDLAQNQREAVTVALNSVDLCALSSKPLYYMIKELADRLGSSRIALEYTRREALADADRRALEDRARKDEVEMLQTSCRLYKQSRDAWHKAWVELDKRALAQHSSDKSEKETRLEALVEELRAERDQLTAERARLTEQATETENRHEEQLLVERVLRAELTMRDNDLKESRAELNRRSYKILAMKGELDALTGRNGTQSAQPAEAPMIDDVVSPETIEKLKLVGVPLYPRTTARSVIGRLISRVERVNGIVKSVTEQRDEAMASAERAFVRLSKVRELVSTDKGEE